MLSNKLGYTNVFWSMAYKDWEVNNQKGGQYAYDQIMKRIHPGAIMLIHSISSDNAEALPQVIDDARKQGYVFKSLDDLMLTKHLQALKKEVNPYHHESTSLLYLICKTFLTNGCSNGF